MPTAGLIHQFFTSFQICLVSFSSETGCQKSDDQMQPKGWTKPFPCDTGAHPAEVFPSSTEERDPLSLTTLKTQKERNPRDPRVQQGAALHI